MDNLQRLTDRINQTSNPRRTLAVLAVVLAAAKGDFDGLTPERIRNILEGPEEHQEGRAAV